MLSVGSPFSYLMEKTLAFEIALSLFAHCLSSSLGCRHSVNLVHPWGFPLKPAQCWVQSWCPGASNREMSSAHALSPPGQHRQRRVAIFIWVAFESSGSLAKDLPHLERTGSQKSLTEMLIRSLCRGQKTFVTCFRERLRGYFPFLCRLAGYLQTSSQKTPGKGPSDTAGIR